MLDQRNGLTWILLGYLSLPAWWETGFNWTTEIPRDQDSRPSVTWNLAWIVDICHNDTLFCCLPMLFCQSRWQKSLVETAMSLAAIWFSSFQGFSRVFSMWVSGLALSDTHVFLLNEYFIELNTANFKILNKLLNWILSGNRKLNQLLNWILLTNENLINFWIEFVEKQNNE